MPDLAPLATGDYVLFQDSRQARLLCHVKSVVKYKNFRQMLLSTGVAKMLPTLTNSDNPPASVVARATKLYRNFPDYRTNVKKYGALAFAVRCDPQIHIGKLRIIKINDD